MSYQERQSDSPCQDSQQSAEAQQGYPSETRSEPGASSHREGHYRTNRNYPPRENSYNREGGQRRD